MGERVPSGGSGSSAEGRRAVSEEALLAAAVELVSEYGIEGTTLERIGQRAGLSRSLATYHFGSKDVLVERLAERAQDRISSAISRSLGDGLELDDLPALERVRRTVDAQLQLLASPAADDRAFVVLWAATFPSRSSRSGMKAADDRGLTGWREVVADGHRDGSIRADADPVATATWLMGLTRGLAATLVNHPVSVANARMRQTCDLLITEALSPPATGEARRGGRDG